MGMTHAQAMAAAVAARGQMDEGDDIVDGEEAVVEKTLQQIEAERVAAEEAEAKRVQAERLSAVRERFQKGVRKAAKAAKQGQDSDVATDDGGLHDSDGDLVMSDLRAAEVDDANRERAKAKENQELLRRTGGKSAGKYLAGSENEHSTASTGNVDVRAKFRAGVNKVKAANAAAAASRLTPAHGMKEDETNGIQAGGDLEKKDRRGRDRRSSQERENGISRHRNKSSRQKHGDRKHRHRGRANRHEKHPFEVPTGQNEDGQPDDEPEQLAADVGEDISSSGSSSGGEDDTDPEPVIVTGELVMALP